MIGKLSKNWFIQKKLVPINKLIDLSRLKLIYSIIYGMTTHNKAKILNTKYCRW